MIMFHNQQEMRELEIVCSRPSQTNEMVLFQRRNHKYSFVPFKEK
jgi:hypothetical protein